MKKDAIINNKKIHLTDEEKEAGEAFHRKRYAFAWINGKITFNDNINDDRDHQHWLCEDYSLSVEDWEKTPRGYMLPDRIQLFIGSKFEQLNTNKISMGDFNTLLKVHGKRYNTLSVTVYNGVKIGKIGEVWEPIEKLGTYAT